MASIRKRGRNWYYQYIDADGVKRERKGCPDRRETERMARAAENEAAKIKAGLVDPRDLAHKAHGDRPIAEHLDGYERYLLAKGDGAAHAGKSRRLAARVLKLAGVDSLGSLTPAAATTALGLLRDEGLAQATINHHVRAVKAFSRWLWREGRLREHVLAHLATRDPDADRRRVRRALTVEESALLLQAAAKGPSACGLSGPDRAQLYALALGTGFRASELASLTPESFRLADEPPAVVAMAAYTKNKREAVQPISRDLAETVRPWLRDKPAGRPLFGVAKLCEKTAEMVRFDLKAAGIAYEAPNGVADFHALRVTYISRIVAGGANVKTAQHLARHSTPSLTIGVYAKPQARDVASAVEALPTHRGGAVKPKQATAPRAARLTHKQRLCRTFAARRTRFSAGRLGFSRIAGPGPRPAAKAAGG